MTSTDWVLFIVVATAALTQLYFGAKYRGFFVIDSKTINKSYISQILEFNRHHPIAGSIYLLLVATQMAGLVCIVLAKWLKLI